MQQYLVLTELNFDGKRHAPFDVVELDEQKARVTFVNKVMPLCDTPEPQDIPQKSSIDPDRPLAKYLRREELRQREAAGVYVDRELLFARKQLRADIATFRHEISLLADKRADAVHTHEILKIDAEQNKLEQQLSASKAALSNVQNKLDLAVAGWHELQREIFAVEKALAGWARTAPYEQGEVTHDDEIDELVLDFCAYERSIANSHKSMRHHFERRMQECKKQLDEALRKEEQI